MIKGKAILNSEGECLNIGNPRGTVTIFGIALASVRMTYSKSRIVFVGKDVADIEPGIPDIEKTRTTHGFQPKINLEEGVKLIADWHYDKIEVNTAFKTSLIGS